MAMLNDWSECALSGGELGALAVGERTSSSCIGVNVAMRVPAVRWVVVILLLVSITGTVSICVVDADGINTMSARASAAGSKIPCKPDGITLVEARRPGTNTVDLAGMSTW